MKLLSLYLTLLLGSLVHAAPSESTSNIKESIIAPRGWVKRAPAPSDYAIELRIALPQPDFDELERHLYEISDPDHHRYGKYLTKEKIEEISSPSLASINAVRNWLVSHGYDEEYLSASSTKDGFRIRVPVSQAEEMLNTKYHIWEHTATGKTAVRTTAYSLPEELHVHVELVHPTIVFPGIRSMASSARLIPDIEVSTTNSSSSGGVDPVCNNEITIKCLQQIYKFVDYRPSADSGSRIGLTGYLEMFANEQDLQSFYADQRHDALNSSFALVSVNGGLNSQNLSEAGLEANLDVQFGLGLTFPLPGTFYSTAGRPPFKPDLLLPENTNEPYLDWLDFVLSHPNPPQVISTSYGEDEQTIPESYGRAVCKRFAQLGARGVSLFFSSGDSGVGDANPDPTTQMCKTNDGHNTTRFLPAFPASCPYVTTIGGTHHFPEVATSFSGGGFSDLFPRPSYQDDAVTEYLEKLPNGTYIGLFNKTGRAYPDLSAQSNNFAVFLGGVKRHVQGTSASAPTAAAIFALLNDARLRQGLPVLGFLNPLLYKIRNEHPDAFNDVTHGNNPGCGTQGFNATQGWDPVTGLGTPNFEKLKDIVLSMK
ncbi:hypothetical protein QCA50_000954 [Cerrena zonata]|uniref:tripeptidyl-peptidase II n=1 Tax=Cerrena zonata TaxID=2478898 RepID=A0AAW0GSV0_9APHY